jgi:hypothetical protein
MNPPVKLKYANKEVKIKNKQLAPPTKEKHLPKLKFYS